MTTATKPATSFWIICIIALLWNLIGIMAFTMDILITPEALQQLPEAQRELYESNPAWNKFVYGVAVFSGTLGSILLLMKKASAYRIFLISLVAIIVQMSYSVFFSEAIEAYGITAIVMPILVTGIAIFLLWFSKFSIKKGWIG